MAECDKYDVLEKIGHGSFGIIRKVRRKADGHVLCRKEISYARMSHKEKEQLQAELSILKGLRHPNIVAYYEREHHKASSDLHIYMEFCEQGDLGRYIKDLKRSSKMADEDFVWSVFSQLVTALYRCHYGEDPPEVGRHVVGLSNDAKPLKSKAPHAMILHRDLKPENIFLGSDASVKLGDFGLSKILQSHDFASTYVGTPFYMSPEICAAEQYSLHSDIWAFGCIMYELCAKEPPFNAKTHLDLIQKIRLGRITPLSHLYSTELKDAVSKCLRVNPSTRPDTVALLNIPMVKLKRKELEIVTVGKYLRTKEEQAARMLKDAEMKLAHLEAEKQATRMELDSIIRREWEVKARLEIDRQVQQMKSQLWKDFEAEVGRRVTAETQQQQQPVRSSTPSGDEHPLETLATSYHQSQSTTGETDDFPSSTDLSELSLGSTSSDKAKPKRSNRNPLARARTMFDGSPADVHMVDPSPAPIGSLNLSPRRNERRPAPRTRNIFAAAATSSPLVSDADDCEADDDELPALPSPTRAKQKNNDPFKALNAARRPGLLRQKTAPQKQPNQPAIFSGVAARLPTKEPSQTNLRTAIASKATEPTSPIRRVSKLPSANNLNTAASPSRRAPEPSSSPQRRPPSRKDENADVRQVAALSSQIHGRTLVELQQARTVASGVSVHDFGHDLHVESGLKKVGSGGENTKPAANVTIWDPEKDEMPSPFLARGGRGILSGVAGGPGMRHLR